MATYYVDPQHGNDANDGLSDVAPWKLIPGQTGANSVSGGDTILVRNGTTTTLRIQPPANNLTYRGYGLADNVLFLNLPGKNVRENIVTQVVREDGVHEGMWTIDASALGVSGIDIQNARTGIVMEDFSIIPANGINAVTVGTSAATTSGGVTLRRFEIQPNANNGVSIFKINVTMDYFKVSNCTGDGWSISANANNSYRSGSVDTITNFEIVEPNTNKSGVVTGTDGDGWQTFHTSGRYEGKLTVRNWTLKKSNAVKQAFLVCDGLGGIVIDRFRIIGTPLSCNTALFTCLRGNVRLSNGYWKDGIFNNGAIRMRSAETALSQLLYTGAKLTITKCIVDADTIDSFFDAAESTETLEMDGTLVLTHNTVKGNVVSNVASAGFVSLLGGNTTYGTNFVLTCKNNLFLGTGYGVRMPTGTAGTSRYAVTNNGFTTGQTHSIGATAYADLAAFEAAHNAATDNLEATSYVNDTLYPTGSSSALSAGVATVETSDHAGKTFYTPPTIGALERVPTRLKREPIFPLPGAPINYNVAPGNWQSEVASVGANYVDMTDTSFYSRVLRRRISYSVGLPDDYGSSGINYPVVWHFHGQVAYPGTNNRYISASFPARYGFAVRDGYVRDHITIFVNGLNYSMYVDNYDKSIRWETMFLTELKPLIHATYRTLGTDPQHNACMGFSMGGRGSIYYALKHNDKFGGCAAYGPPLYDENYDYAGDSNLDDWAPYIISPDETYNDDQMAVWLLNSPQGHLNKDHSNLKLRICYGDSDNLRNTTGAEFKARMTRAGVPFTAPADLVGVSHTASQYWTNADSNNAFAFVETIFAGA